MQELVSLIRENAEDVADASGKTALDSKIEKWIAHQPGDLVDSLRAALPEINETHWKEWRAFRQIVGRIGLRSDALRNDLAVMTEELHPSDSRARFYAYLARQDLGDAPSLDELRDDAQLRNERPGDWLQLALSQASPSTLRAEIIKMADRLKANDFVFTIGLIREKYGESFVEWMTELCLAMPFTEALSLANLVDEEYNCGLHSEVLMRHSKLRGDPPDGAAMEPLWESLDEQFKLSILEKA